MPLRSINQSKLQFKLEESLGKINQNGRTNFELTTLDDSSKGKVLSAALSRIADSKGLTVGCTLILRDTSAETNLRRQLEHQANHDALTGCTNRHFFESQLFDLLNQKIDHKSNNALLYLDLDQFKVVNDTAGHRAGDQLLIDLTARMLKVTRNEDTLSRIGGDEFGLIISNVAKEEAQAYSERILGVFENYLFTHQSHSFPISASLGLVHFSETSYKAADVLAAADMACYAAKEGGRNRLFVYSADNKTMTERSDELNWLTRLRHALDNNLFQLFAQPLANLKLGGCVTHFEFLLRLIDENGTEVTPWQIIQAAERYGLMRDLDRWIISKAIQTVSELEGYDSIGFSINLSGQSAADPTLIKFIQEQYQIHKVDPTRLCFELTETAAISNYGTAIELIEAIQLLGSRVALDDFGSGLSSFGYLKTLPVDILKIDGQFVRDLASNSVDRAMVKAIRDVAESMNLLTVAEYVENQAIVSILQDIGIDYAQGYHISRPLPLEQALLIAGDDNDQKILKAA